MIALNVLASFFMMLFCQTESHSNASVYIEVNGIKALKGSVGVLVFDKPEGFPDNAENAILSKMVKVTSNQMNIELKELSYGAYAIAIFQDVNSNNILDLNFLGIPKEPFGFSNNNSILFGPPDYEDAEIYFSAKQMGTSIKLINL